MTIKEKRKYLSEYQNIQNQIFGLVHELEKWKSVGEKVNSAMSNSGSTGKNTSSKVELSAVNTSDIIRTIQFDITEAERKRADIINTLNQKCRRLRHKEILTMYFVNGMSVYSIARKLNKDDKTVSNSITNALREMDI